MYPLYNYFCYSLLNAAHSIAGHGCDKQVFLMPTQAFAITNCLYFTELKGYFSALTLPGRA